MDVSKANETVDILVRKLSSGDIEEGVAFFREKSGELPEPLRLECLGNISFY